MVALSSQKKMANKADKNYIKVSSQYELLLQTIITEGWQIMALGFIGDKTGKYSVEKMALSIKNYDLAWQKFNQLKAANTSCASLYKPFAFTYTTPNYHQQQGMESSINKYRKLVTKY